MDTQAALDEIKTLSDLAEQRKKKAEPKGMNQELANPSLSYLTSDEKARFHELKLSLPSHGEEALKAKIRIRQRIRKRNRHE